MSLRALASNPRRIRLAVLGCGNMGSAIAVGLAKKSKNISLITYEPQYARALRLARKAGGRAARSLADLRGCDYFLIACKPQQFMDLAAQLCTITRAESKVLSVMAGVRVAKIKRALGIRKVARLMPNLPCGIGFGTCAIYFSGMPAAEQKMVLKIFSPIAQIYPVKSEEMMDAATAVIGSGPAYLFELARIFAAKTSRFGFPQKTAEAIIKNVFFGASALLLQSPKTSEELRNQVTSKKGTTAAALALFQKFGLEKILGHALLAAYRRAKTLSGK